MMWEKLKECLMSIAEKGNCILVTSRSSGIEEMIEEKLVFSHFANANEVPMTSNFKFVRDELVKKIGGLPLLAKVLGAAVQLSSDHEQWTNGQLKAFEIFT
ncbi:hypothetical protein Csa_019177 [Cucumis sativus]|uniref:NB-ARC domain-containing protein n=1 Tax=Cucumis sativus TaxID=3659 RepID=A0A0A0LG14_CUCSA|nr:hypothetical protein Csa_019177 [Cucumis sativus]